MRRAAAGFLLLCIPGTLLAQTPAATPQTAEELATQTALLKAQQAYYDQLAATFKSQAALSSLEAVNATAAVKAQTDLQTAQMTKDLALANALKGAGLTAPTGKAGNVTFAAGTATFLPLQQASLVATDQLADAICKALHDHNVTGAFIAPADFEKLIEKGTVDVLQLRSLHQAAVLGNTELAGVQLQVATTAFAGALLSAEYMAGGIETLTKLFRSDYAVALSTNSRPNLLEQRLAVKCGAGVLTSNKEGMLRLNAAKILTEWLPDMANFVQRYETLNDQATAKMAALTAERTAASSDATLSADQKRTRLAQLKQEIDKLNDQEALIAKFKSSSATIKTFFSALTPASSLFDSLVWAQDVLFSLGGVPAGLPQPHIQDRPRLTCTLNVQDATVTKSSTFSASQVKGVSTVEAYFAVTDTSGVLLSGVYSHTAETPPLSFKATAQPSYESVIVRPAPPAGGGSRQPPR